MLRQILIDLAYASGALLAGFLIGLLYLSLRDQKKGIVSEPPPSWVSVGIVISWMALAISAMFASVQQLQARFPLSWTFIVIMSLRFIGLVSGNVVLFWIARHRKDARLAKVEHLEDKRLKD